MGSSKNRKGGIIALYIITGVLFLFVLLAFVPGIINSIQLKKAEAAIGVLQKSKELVSTNYANRVPMRHICFDGRFDIDYCSDNGELHYSFETWDVTLTANPVARRTITAILKPTFEQGTILWHCMFMDDQNKGRVYGFDCEEGRRFVN
jgi:hypothetical protein